MEEIFVNAVLFESKDSNLTQQQQHQYASGVQSVTYDDDIDDLVSRTIAVNNQNSTLSTSVSATAPLNNTITNTRRFR